MGWKAHSEHFGDQLGSSHFSVGVKEGDHNSDEHNHDNFPNRMSLHPGLGSDLISPGEIALAEERTCPPV